MKVGLIAKVGTRGGASEIAMALPGLDIPKLRNSLAYGIPSALRCSRTSTGLFELFPSAAAGPLDEPKPNCSLRS